MKAKNNTNELMFYLARFVLDNETNKTDENSSKTSICYKNYNKI